MRITPTGITWIGISIIVMIIIGFIAYIGLIYVTDDGSGYVGVHLNPGSIQTFLSARAATA